MKKYYLLPLLTLLALQAVLCGSTAAQQHSIKNVGQKMAVIKSILDSNIFVNRFQSIETPCVYINPKKINEAYRKNGLINSNYRVVKEPNPEATGNVKCLSEYCARYMQLRVETVDTTGLIIKGSLQSTYSYPASSIIQMLTFSSNAVNSTAALFKTFISGPGSFTIYPQNGEYLITMVLEKDPYSNLDTVFGTVELTNAIFNIRHPLQVTLNFTRISIHNGDNNNEISLPFTTTNYQAEANYYQGLYYTVFKHRHDTDKSTDWYNAVYLDNFLVNPSCKSIYQRLTFWQQLNTTQKPVLP